MNSPSGVNASGPLIIVTTSAVCSTGTSPNAFSASCSNRSQSSGSS